MGRWGGRGRRESFHAAMRMNEGSWTGFEQVGQPEVFPDKIEVALEQAGSAVLAALDDGHERIGIHMTMPEFNPKEMPLSQGCIMAFVNNSERPRITHISPPQSNLRTAACLPPRPLPANAFLHRGDIEGGRETMLPGCDPHPTLQWEAALWSAGLGSTSCSTLSKMRPKQRGW